MGKDNQKKTANVAQDGAVYDADRFVRCQRCGSWINARNPSSLFEHRGPLPHPRIAGAEWIDDDD
jgi:adenine-specific DNA methylase